MKNILLICAIFLPCIFAVENWCGLASCKGREHVDCKMANGQFGAACSDNAVMLNLQPAQATILNKFNTFRNKVAGGLLQNKFAATRMGTLQWNITLANLARKNVKKCTFTQDACMNTPDFDYVGQSIARSVLPLSDTTSNLDRILSMIDFWFSEHVDATMANIRQFTPPTENGPTIANFEQCVRDYATRVGCAALKYEDENSVMLLTCNFDMANVVGYPVYIDGPVARDCKTGKNPSYPYLCSTKEVYNINKFWEDFQ